MGSEEIGKIVSKDEFSMANEPSFEQSLEFSKNGHVCCKF